MSHINAIHGKRHIVVCITHHEAKIFIVISFAFFRRFVCVCMSLCVVCSRVWIFGCRPLFGLFTHNENRFNSFGLQVVVCVFLYLLLSHDVTDFCVQAFPTDEQIVVLVPDYFYCFFACSFNFFSFNFNCLLDVLSGNKRTACWSSSIWYSCIFELHSNSIAYRGIQFAGYRFCAWTSFCY